MLQGLNDKNSQTAGIAKAIQRAAAPAPDSHLHMTPAATDIHLGTNHKNTVDVFMKKN